MNLVQDKSAGAHAVSVPCLECGRMVSLSEAFIDTEGPAFRAYYHGACLPEDARAQTLRLAPCRRHEHMRHGGRCPIC